MADLQDIITEIEKYGSFTFSRSSGPGGQNVNKLNTNVLLKISISDLAILGTRQKELLRKKMSNRINTDDELFLHAQQERSQLRNRRLAVIRMAELINNNIHEEKPRRKTKPSRSAKEGRLSEKKRHSTIKKNRGRPSEFI